MKQFFTPKNGPKAAFYLLFSIAIALIVIAGACNKFEEDFDFNKLVTPEWNPEFAVPLVNSTLFLSDFLEDSSNLNIVVNPDKSLIFVYSSDSIISANAGDFAGFPDQDFVFLNDFEVPAIPPGFFDTISLVENYQFIPDTSSQRIDSIFLDEGFLSIEVETNLNRDVTILNLTIPDIRTIATNEPLVITGNLNNPNGQQAWVGFDDLVDLSQYKIGLNQISDTVVNNISFLLDIFIQGDDNPNLSPYEFKFNGELYDLEFDRAFGYFSQYELEFVDSLEIGIFEDAINGTINIGERAVSLVFDIHNSIGAPVTFVSEVLEVTSDVNPPYQVGIELFGPGVPNIFTVNSPEISQIGESVVTELDFTEANFAEAFNIAPQWLNYHVAAITNFENDTTAENFLLSESNITLDVDLEFSLFGSIASFTVEDTVKLDFDENPEEIEYMMMRMNLTNGFPIDARAQVYFADIGYIVLDSLIADDSNILPGATVGGAPDYKVIEPAKKITDVMIDKPRLNNIIDSEYLIFRTTLSTSDQQLVKIYEDYNIIFKLGTITGLTVDSNN